MKRISAMLVIICFILLVQVKEGFPSQGKTSSAANHHPGAKNFNLDLMFVVDGSRSSERYFPNMLNWIKAVSSNFIISDGSTRIGVIQYSAFLAFLPLDKQPYVVNEIPLGKYRSQQKLREALDRIALQGYTSDTAAGLDLTALDFQNSERFNFANTLKVAIVITDGKSTDANKLPSSVDHLRSLGVTTFAVGVGDADMSGLKEIASGISNNVVASINSYDGIKKIVDGVKKLATGR